MPAYGRPPRRRRRPPLLGPVPPRPLGHPGRAV